MKCTYCNKCGKQIGFKRDAGDKYSQDYNVFSVHTYIGYGSKYDTQYLSLDLCSSCMDELIDSCAITPVEEPNDFWVADEEYCEAVAKEENVYA